MNIQSSVVQEVLQRRWEPRRWGESWPAIGRWQGPIERIIKADDPHNYTLSCRRTRRHHSAVFWHLKQIGEVEKLLSVDLMNWLQIQKKSLFWSVVFSYPLQQQWTISWLDCDVRLQVDFIHQPATNDQISGWSKKKFPSISQSQTCTKKRSRSLFSGLLPAWSSSFLNPGKTITSEKYAQQIDEIHQKLQCLQPPLVNRKGPILCCDNADHTSHNQWFTTLMNWSAKVCLICHIHLTSCQLTTTSSSISTTFCRENASTTSRRQKMLSKSSSNPGAQMFML